MYLACHSQRRYINTAIMTHGREIRDRRNNSATAQSALVLLQTLVYSIPKMNSSEHDKTNVTLVTLVS